jgi:SsrA-binding protein
VAKSGKKKKGGDPDRIATNRRALHDYEILDSTEAGIALVGPEVKSLRAGHATLGDAYVVFRKGEAWLMNLHITHYTQAGRSNVDPTRERKLLLHRNEISRWASKVAEKGLTVIPLNLHWTNGRAKVELGLARGKRSYDKRHAIREREEQRDVDRAMRHGRR